MATTQNVYLHELYHKDTTEEEVEDMASTEIIDKVVHDKRKDVNALELELKNSKEELATLIARQNFRIIIMKGNSKSATNISPEQMILNSCSEIVLEETNFQEGKVVFKDLPLRLQYYSDLCGFTLPFINCVVEHKTKLNLSYPNWVPQAMISTGHPHCFGSGSTEIRDMCRGSNPVGSFSSGKFKGLAHCMSYCESMGKFIQTYTIEGPELPHWYLEYLKTSESMTSYDHIKHEEKSDDPKIQFYYKYRKQFKSKIMGKSATRKTVISRMNTIWYLEELIEKTDPVEFKRRVEVLLFKSSGFKKSIPHNMKEEYNGLL